MPVDYVAIAEKVSIGLKKAGQKVILHRVIGESRDPITGVVTPGRDDSKETIGVVKAFLGGEVDTARVESGDRLLVIDASVEPILSDKPFANGKSWTIVSIKPQSPAGVPVQYVLHIRN